MATASEQAKARGEVVLFFAVVAAWWCKNGQEERLSDFQEGREKGEWKRE
jgi:hypothetical protein